MAQPIIMDRLSKIRQMLEAHPQDRFLQHALGLELIKAGDEAGAREVFERLLTEDPTYIGTYYHLGKLLERSGEPESASRWYRQGISQARTAGDAHALRELQAALDQLETSSP